MNKIENISLKLIKADPKQPRQEFAISAMNRLAVSIKELGILNPLALEKINGTYLIIDGERRFRAAVKLGLKEVPAYVSDKMSDSERLIRRFHLQEQHSGWSALDKAVAITNIQQILKINNEEVAKMLGLSETTVNSYIVAMSLSKRTLYIAESKKIPLDYLREIAWVSKNKAFRKIKTELEEALIKKVEDGVIERGRQIRFYGQAMSNAKNEKIAGKILNDILKKPKFSPYDALEAADLVDIQKIKSMTGSARWLISNLKRAIENNLASHLQSVDVSDFEKLVKTVERFVSLSGYVLPKEK